MERVVITGIGLVTPLAIGTRESWSAALEGRSGGAPISLFSTEKFRVKIAAEVKQWQPERWIPRKKIKELDRFIEFALVAGQFAVADAGLELTPEEADETGCLIGVGMGGLKTLEIAKEIELTKGPGRISPYSLPALIPNMAAGQLSMAHGLRGPSFATASACSSAAHAIGEASDWIRLGRASVMVTGGAEACVTPIGIGGFEAMYALSRRNDAPERASRPFDKGRDGFLCGEGAGILILESLTRARKRGAKIYAEITGYGASSDAYHLTHPAPEGEGAQRAMRSALRSAKLAPDAIDYVNAHGTSTPLGDVQESKAMERVFGTHATDKKLWISSTKSMTGHLLGAAGAVESAFCVLSITDGRVPPTINLDEPDPECILDYVPHHARERSVQHAMNNSFGFGGTNCTIVFSRFTG